MTAAPLHIVSFVALPAEVVQALSTSVHGPFSVQACSGGVHALAAPLQPACDALLIDRLRGAEASDVLAYAGADTATLLVATDLGPEEMLTWWQRGVQDVLAPTDLAAASLPARIRAAIERKRLERDARKAFATDLETGLPHQQQLIEHTSQLLALREREPSPMALLALRVEGLASAELRLGRDAAQVLRRKVGVRLRAGVRASDVVASIGDDSFAVLLGSLLTAADAERVGDKLRRALLEPFKVNGNDVAVAVALGIGQYPQDGTQPDALLRRATGLAAAAQALGRTGWASFHESGRAGGGAANDESR